LIGDFSDSAALMANLDMLISVDSAPVHLAGALGIPVWTLLPYVPDWRWLLGRDDSPWYPSMRLFRQDQLGDWSTPLQAVCSELCRLFGQEQPAEIPLDEANRRKLVISQHQTDIIRWRQQEQLKAAFNARAKIVAEFIPTGARVFDIGCGAMALEHFLPKQCTYIPCDVVPRDTRTIVCDLNTGSIPVEARQADRITVMSVLEYLYEPLKFLKELREVGKPTVLTYCVSDWTQHLDRGALGWVNHLSLAELEENFQSADLNCRCAERIDQNQAVFLLEPGCDPSND
jgi:hypothetical protein